MKTKTLAEYFEAITAAVFQSGLSAQVVQAKWSGFENAFASFDPRVVADFTPDEVDTLLSDESIIRNRRKIEAMVVNANLLLELDEERGFGEWLDSHEDEETAAAAVSREFRFIGPGGARTFLRMVSSDDEYEAC